MSDSQFSDAKLGRWFGAMILAMIVLTGLLMVLATVASSDVNERLDQEAAVAKTETLNQEIAPIGQLTVGSAAAPVIVAKAEPKPGDIVYAAACAACHGAGVAGAPKYGDAADWGTRASQGNDTLYKNAINGYSGSAGYMPPRGGNANLSDDEVKGAVDYILAGSK